MRGGYPDKINSRVFFKIGRALGKYIENKGKVLLLRDTRETSLELSAALRKGLECEGIEISDQGISPTEVLGHAMSANQYSLGVIVTASHNPPSDNGVKVMLPECQNLSEKDQKKLNQLISLIPEPEGNSAFSDSEREPEVSSQLTGLIEKFQPLAKGLPATRILAHGLEGCSPLLSRPLLQDQKVNWFGAGTSGVFPSAGPDPATEAFASEMRKLMIEKEYDLGVAWDGDGDRCMFFDPSGTPLDNTIVSAILIKKFMRESPEATVLIDPKRQMLQKELIEESGGRWIQVKTGHVNFRRAMKFHRAIYGGESSGHHYFQSFYGSDSGVLPWIEILKEMTHQGFWSQVEELRTRVSHLAEHSFVVEGRDAFMEDVEKNIGANALKIENFDGLSCEFSEWRFNLRPSNTENKMRLNIEGRLTADDLSFERDRILSRKVL